MNLNNFVVLPNKPKSVKLNVRNLRELRMETAQLTQENMNMESRLQQLRETMSREKEERVKNGAFYWKSGQTQDGTKDKEKKLNKNTPIKMKIRLLKDEPLPVQRVPEPPPPKNGWSRKSRLKGHACGQCEARAAGLVCAECTEDYCVSCFAKFHQKGALRFHHIIPMQAELHTSISTLDVVNRFQKTFESEEEEDCWSTHGGDLGTDPERRATSCLSQSICDNQMNSTQVLIVHDMGEENKDSLLSGKYNEEESARSFQQALKEWRAGNTHGDIEHYKPKQTAVQTAQTGSMEVMGNQAEEITHIRIEFRKHGLSYMERLLLKKHRRTQIESYQLLSTRSTTQGPVTDTCIESVEETHKTRELTAEEMDLHRYCTSLFAVSRSAATEVVNDIFKSCLSITEIDETAGDASIEVKQKDKNMNKEVVASAMHSQAEEILHIEKPLDFSLKAQTLEKEAMLSGSEESFLQSPPSDQFFPSLTVHQLQKSVDFSILTGPEMLTTKHYKELALDEGQSSKLLKPQISTSPLKNRSVSKCTTQQHGGNTLRRTLSQRCSDFHNPLITRNPFSPISVSVEDWDPSLSLSFRSNSSMSPEDQSTIYAKLLKPALSEPIQHGEDEVFNQFLQSPRLIDFNKLQTPRSPPKVTSTQSSDSSFCPQSYASSPSTSIQCLSPAVSISARIKLSPTPSELYHIRAKALTPPFTESFSQTQSGNTPSQSQAHLEHQKLPLPTEQRSSDEEEAHFLLFGSSLPLTKSEILKISPTLCQSLSESDMSIDSVDMIPNDEDSSDEEIKRCALQVMKNEEEGNTFAFSPSPLPTAEIPFPSQSLMMEEQSGFFTKPSLAVRSLAQRHKSVSTNYQGLDGFFTLGLDSRSVPLSPAPSHTSPKMQTCSTHSEALMSGDSIWRPENSLRPAKTKPVCVINNNQPISITSRSVTPFSKIDSRRLSQSDALTPVIQRVSHPLCASRPFSRAALEIQEVQSVEQAEATHLKQDEEDLFTISCLEEEFKQMITELN